MKKMSMMMLVLGLSALNQVSAAPVATKKQANDNPKVVFIKQFYADYLNENIHAKRLNQYYSADLKKLFARDDKIAKKNEEEIACLDFDYVIQGQDYDEKEILKTLKVSMTPKGWVRASFKNFNENQQIDYQVQCKGNQCQIEDLSEPEGSLKRSLAACLNELENTKSK